MTSLRTLSVCFAVSLLALPLRAQDPTLADIKKSIDDLKAYVERSNLATFQEMVDLRKRLQALEKSVDEMKRIPSRPPAIEALGEIDLENRLAVPATIIVNDQAYRLRPFETRRLSQPYGPFSFEVLVDGFGSLQPRVTRSLTLTNTPYRIFTYMP